MAGTGPLWDDEPWAAGRPLAGEEEADLAVIGLGGSGLSAVLEGRRRGLRVVGIDAGVVGGGAAGRNGGFALAGLADFHHVAVGRIGRSRAVAAYRLTLDELDRLEAEASTGSSFRRTGSLRVAADPEELVDCARHLEALRADGLCGESYEGPEGAGLLLPSDGVLQPLDRCRALAGQARGEGALLFEHTPAMAVEPGQVRTPEGRIVCASVVVAVDGGLEKVVPQLAGRVRTARLQMLASAPTAEISAPRPVYRRHGYDYWRQLPTGEVVVGGCRDLFGEAEWGAPAEPTAPVQAAIEGILRNVIGVRRARITHRWAGQVAFTEDHLPVLEATGPGMVVAGAYNGTGNVLGALAGRAAVELAITGFSPVAAVLSGAA